MRLTLILATFFLFPPLAFSATYYVPDDHITIQDAINAAANGDTIIVRAGTYVENIDFIGKAITVQSEQGAAVTTIDGNQAGPVVLCVIGEGPDTVLDGFTITNGSSSLGGAGMVIDSCSPTVQNCIFRDNVTLTGNGGGMYNLQSTPTIDNCTFISNYAQIYGGGMYNDESNPTVTKCTFESNQAFEGGGGGMANRSSDPLVTECVFTGNMTDEGHGGGGMLNDNFSMPTVDSCTFTGNSTGLSIGQGGGMYNDMSTPLVLNSTFTGNSSINGGGMITTHMNPTIINCMFIDNTATAKGGGMANDSSGPIVVNCSFALNVAAEGGGIFGWDDDTVITNCILWNDSPDEIGLDGGDPTVTYSCIEGGWSGNGNIDDDPLFADAANGDLHLTWDSPCRDAGDNDAVSIQVDFERDLRITGFDVDMGADEYWHHLYLIGDPVPGGSVTLKVVGVPDKDPVKIYRGSLRASPQSTQYGVLFIMQPFTHIWDVGPIPLDGIASMTQTIPAGASPGAEFHLQAQHGPLGNANTKLTNLLTVTVK